ncbi:hypothetical protein P691DRAFT_777495 [Macrolepiota fuliginosa MF-IS2]|uniref:DUF6533 domain-containing protein n=1 Tax=Macrolepiota fuliginosa MF-IS2 TaxID=1400762 RepID=A0A9P5X9H3_9AGAR|nr:hypothetical protein P691DRAFT_777495 [Macrolepiota fuliginosa MF-IS2]
MAILLLNGFKLSEKLPDGGEYIESLQGTRNAQTLTVALFSWFVYEYCITFPSELQFFWEKRDWTRGRGLFFINRYMTWLAMIASLYVVFVRNPTLQVTSYVQITILMARSGVHGAYTSRSLPTSYALGLDSVPYLTNKFWNIFENRRDVRVALALGLGLSISASLVLLSMSTKSLIILAIPDATIDTFISAGCKGRPLGNFWATYIPPLIFHAYLYALAIHLAIRNKKYWEFSSATRKVFWDGSATYFVASITLLCTIIFSSKTQIPWLSLPATYSPIALTATSITLTREAIATRMLLTHRTTVLSSSQDDPMANAIELVPMNARGRRLQPSNHRPQMVFAHSSGSVMS